MCVLILGTAVICVFPLPIHLYVIKLQNRKGPFTIFINKTYSSIQFFVTTLEILIITY